MNIKNVFKHGNYSVEKRKIFGNGISYEHERPQKRKMKTLTKIQKNKISDVMLLHNE